MRPNEVIAACPHKIARARREGCCAWGDFLDSFAECWPRWFDGLPTPHQWTMARSDWRAGNTGFEAAHNAQRRIKEANTPAARQERETRALARSVIAVARKTPAGVKVCHSLQQPRWGCPMHGRNATSTPPQPTERELTLADDHATRNLATDYFKAQGFFDQLRAAGVAASGGSSREDVQFLIDLAAQDRISAFERRTLARIARQPASGVVPPGGKIK